MAPSEAALQDLGGAAARALMVDPDARQGRGAEEAERFVVVRADDPGLVRHGQSGALARAQGEPRDDVVAAEESERARQRGQPSRQRAVFRRRPPPFVRPVDAHVAAGGPDARGKAPVARHAPGQGRKGRHDGAAGESHRQKLLGRHGADRGVVGEERGP